LYARDANYLVRGHHHQDGAAGLAAVVGVHPVVRLLLTHELERLVLASWHVEANDRGRIYVFGGVGR
jgi:hypothetical protein